MGIQGVAAVKTVQEEEESTRKVKMDVLASIFQLSVPVLGFCPLGGEEA